MTSEDRHVTFDYEETYKALFTLCAQHDKSRPVAGSITAINFKADDDKNVAVSFKDELRGTSATSEYSRDFLAAALIVYCRTSQIPLPTRGRKSVELGDDSVTLRITM